MRRLSIQTYLLFIISLIILTNCGDNSSEPSKKSNWYDDVKFDVDWYDDSYTFNVDWTKNTIYFDSSETSALLNIDKENQIYTFDAEDEEAATLAVGDIFVVYKKALRKVKNVSKVGNEIKVDTEDALLVEAIENGTIGWDAGIDFQNPPAVNIKKGDEDIILTPADNNFKFKQKFGDYEYTLEMEFLGDKSKVNCSVEKTIAGALKGKFELEGMISKFRAKNNLKIESQKITNMDYLNDDLNGALTASLVVTASGTDMVKLFELPVTILKYPLPCPIPAALDLRIVFDIRGSVPAGGSSRVSANFKYNSSTGFKYDGIDVNVNGKAGTYEIKDNVTETGAPGAIAANFGIGFPRLALSIGNENIVPWIHTAFVIGGSYTVYPACQTADASFIGAYGIDINITKAINISKEYTLWNMQKELLRSGDCD